MTRKEVHTVPDGKGWKNTVNGKTVSRHRLKRTAKEAGRKQAKSDRAEHVIHKRDGTFGESNSYGNDPYPPKG